MNINTGSLYNELQSMAAQTKLATPGLDQPSVGNVQGSDFGSMLKQAIDGVNNIQQQAGAAKTAVEMGDRSVSLADAMIASQKAGVAFQATVEVRNKFVEAYKEIMSMPV